MKRNNGGRALPHRQVFFEVLADDREVCQDILEDKALIVEEVIV